jgi:hypothetical protein
MLTWRSRSRRVEDQRQAGGGDAVCGIAVPFDLLVLVELYVGYPPEQGFESDARPLFGQEGAASTNPFIRSALSLGSWNRPASSSYPKTNRWSKGS